MMEKRRVKFTFVESLIKEPIIWKLGRQFDVQADRGWVILELEGERDEVDHGLEWVEQQGVRIDPVYEDIVEG